MNHKALAQLAYEATFFSGEQHTPFSGLPLAVQKTWAEVVGVTIAHLERDNDLLLATNQRLLREAEEDRKAIRDMDDVMLLFLHPGDDGCPACAVAVKHRVARERARAHGQPGGEGKG